jgi:hypothetical protein
MRVTWAWVLASLFFFPAMVWVHVATAWKGVLPAVFIGGTSFFLCAGLYLIGTGLSRGRGERIAGGTIIFLFFFLCLQPITTSWIGKTTYNLLFEIVDADSRQPIENALIRIHDREVRSDGSEARTGPNGRAEISYRFITSGTDSLFKKTGWIRFWETELEVSAESYQPVHKELSNLTEPLRDLYGPPLPSLTIRLVKTK